MKATTPLLVLQSVVACTAFTLPENLPNGVYSLHVDAKGREVSEGLTLDHTTTVTPKTPPRHLNARQTKDEGGWDRDQPDLWCGCGTDGEVTQAWYSIWGDVVAFCCASGTFPMSSSRYADHLARITDRCGWYVPGTYSPSSIGLSSVDCGYMNYSPGLKFCDNAEIGRHMGDKGRC
ncbi:hypothetical protein FSARC_13275 [Fusarium sarcochroum]|uniref:Uncharacterized protein n=1 Tax=Fusarium sarcochroum TaxID=1208366 RepID=A0A8H4T2V2_9HYPO|nr:hypothetical protein FSARC_13275 [Fusarium sarcochroum]